MPAANPQAARPAPDRPGFFLLLILAVLLMGGCENRQGGLQTLDGETLETGGKILVVNYWAEWCAPCREEIPELNAFYREHRQRVLVLGDFLSEWCAPCREEIPELNAFYREHRQRVLVLGINFDQLPAEQVRQQAGKFGIEFPLLAAAPEGRWGQPMPQVLPSTLIIDSTGQWRRTLVGPQSAESLAEVVNGLDSGD